MSVTRKNLHLLPLYKRKSKMDYYGIASWIRAVVGERENNASIVCTDFNICHYMKIASFS